MNPVGFSNQNIYSILRQVPLNEMVIFTEGSFNNLKENIQKYPLLFKKFVIAFEKIDRRVLVKRFTVEEFEKPLKGKENLEDLTLEEKTQVVSKKVLPTFLLDQTKLFTEEQFYLLSLNTTSCSSAKNVESSDPGYNGYQFTYNFTCFMGKMEYAVKCTKIPLDVL